MSFQIDETSEFGARAARHLREDTMVWLTTVTPTGAPVPSPVWFVWQEPDTVLMFSQPDSPRIRNLEANPRVALHFDGNGAGGDIVVLSGTATMDPAAAPASDVPAYTEKYGGDIERIGLDPESFSARYSVPVRIALSRLRGH
jgi:PPOX class probable F420-dependent enzyme